MCDVIRVYHWVVVYHWPVDDCMGCYAENPGQVYNTLNGKVYNYAELPCKRLVPIRICFVIF